MMWLVATSPMRWEAHLPWMSHGPVSPAWWHSVHSQIVGKLGHCNLVLLTRWKSWSQTSFADWLHFALAEKCVGNEASRTGDCIEMPCLNEAALDALTLSTQCASFDVVHSHSRSRTKNVNSVNVSTRIRNKINSFLCSGVAWDSHHLEKLVATMNDAVTCPWPQPCLLAMMPWALSACPPSDSWGSWGRHQCWVAQPEPGGGSESSSQSASPQFVSDDPDMIAHNVLNSFSCLEKLPFANALHCWGRHVCMPWCSDWTGWWIKASTSTLFGSTEFTECVHLMETIFMMPTEIVSSSTERSFSPLSRRPWETKQSKGQLQLFKLVLISVPKSTAWCLHSFQTNITNISECN